MTLKNDLLIYIYKNNEPDFPEVKSKFGLPEQELYNQLWALAEDKCLKFKGYPVNTARMLLTPKGQETVESLLESKTAKRFTEIRVNILYPIVSSTITFIIGWVLGYMTK